MTTYYHHNSRIYLVDREAPPNWLTKKAANWDIWKEYLATATSYECRVEGLKESTATEGKDFVWQYEVLTHGSGWIVTDFESFELCHTSERRQVAVAPPVVECDHTNESGFSAYGHFKKREGKLFATCKKCKVTVEVVEQLANPRDIPPPVVADDKGDFPESGEVVYLKEQPTLTDGKVTDGGEGKGRVWPLLGYAPGNYMNKCGRCEKMMSNVDKLCFMCLECAVKEANKMLEAYASMQQPPSHTESAEINKWINKAADLQGDLNRWKQLYEQDIKLPAQQIAGDAWSEYDKQEESFKKLHDKATWVIAYRYALENNPSTTEGYSREFVEGFVQWVLSNYYFDTLRGWCHKFNDGSHGKSHITPTYHTIGDLLNKYKK